MTYEGQQSGDIRATLALSREEAMNGTSRTLNLPGGRQIVVPVPAGIRDGQEIRLEGQGQPSMYGGRGTLILTIALVPAQGQVHEENFGRQPYAQPPTLRLGKKELSRITPHKAPGQLLTMIILSLLMLNDRGSLGMPPHHSSSTSRRSCRHRPSPRQPSNHDNAEGFRQV